MRKTLVYVGEKYDADFPWGGYHVTILGRNNICSEIAKDIIKLHLSAFPLLEGAPGWILSREKFIDIGIDENGMVIAYLKCDELDKFVHGLSSESMLSNFKQKWHISMHTKDVEAAKEQIERWIETRQIFRVYVVDWDSESGQTIWHAVA